MIRSYGLQPDKDIGKPVHQLGLAPIKDESDFESLLPPILNQGQTNACTMFSGVAVRSFYATLKGERDKTFDPLVGYALEREFDGTFPNDVGSSLATTVQVGEKIGFLPDAAAVDFSKLNTLPNPQEHDACAPWKIGGATQIIDLQGLLETLSNGMVVHIGVAIYESFEYQTTAATGIVPMPQPGEKILGYHAMVAAGHRNPEQRVKVRNSWGAAWGQKGYCQFPYDFFRAQGNMISAWRWAV